MVVNIQEQFERYQLFRRILLFYACCLILYATIKSFEYASVSTLPGMELAAVIAAIQVPIVWLTGFLSKLYWGSRNVNGTNY